MVRVKTHLAAAVIGISILLIAACSPVSAPTSTPQGDTEPEVSTPTPPPQSDTKSEGLVLSGALSRDCQSGESPVRGDFGNAGLKIGQTAVDFTLKDTHGTEFRLSQLLAEKPVMMVFGSFT